MLENGKGKIIRRDEELELPITKDQRGLGAYFITEKEFNFLTNFGDENKLSNKVFNGCVTALITLGLPAIIEPPVTSLACGVVYGGLVISFIGAVLSFIICKKAKES